MFKGSLKIAILKVLKDGKYTGYGIRKELTKKAGWSPSYGSLFPNLKELESKKLIILNKKKNKNIYSITSKGKRLLKSVNNKSDKIINEIIKSIDTFGFMWDIDKSKLEELKYIVETMKKSIIVETREMSEFRDVFFGLIKNGKINGSNIKKINKILSDATRKMKKLKG